MAVHRLMGLVSDCSVHIVQWHGHSCQVHIVLKMRLNWMTIYTVYIQNRCYLDFIIHYVSSVSEY